VFTLTAAELATRLKDARRRGDWYDFHCRNHDDTEPSASFSDGDRGIVFVCRSGCSSRDVSEAVAKQLGVRVADFFFQRQRRNEDAPPLTLEEFAAAKHLRVAFLAEHGVRQERRGLQLTYLQRDGTPARQQRKRTALSAKDGSEWIKGAGSPIPYGRWLLDAAMEKGELTFVEGETDSLAGWYHNVPVLGIPGAKMAKVLATEDLRAIDKVFIVQEPERAGAEFVAGLAARLRELAWSGSAYVVRLPVKDLHELHVTAGEAFAAQWLAAQQAATPLQFQNAATSEPELIREGLDLALVWPAERIRFALAAVRDGRSGVTGELTVTHAGRRLHWGAFSLASATARETLRKKLEQAAPDVSWGEYLEEVCVRLTAASRDGEPIVELTGRPTAPTLELMPGFLYEGDITLCFADGDTGKSMFALAIGVAVKSGVVLPCGLRCALRLPVAYLDYETTRDTHEHRLGLLSAGLGIDPPAIFYKRMFRPLADEASALAPELVRRHVGLVIVDSMIFALAGGEGAFHEPVTAFYNALRLFAPAASFVLSHVTAADARSGAPARPYGGAFAHNGPRLCWEAKRDLEVTDATAVAFTCTKANNQPRRPEPFGLRFVPGPGRITIEPFDLTEATATVTAGASVTYRVRLALARGIGTPEAIAEDLPARLDTVKRTLRRLRKAGQARERGDGSDTWEIVS
jgi:AAA domain